MNKPLFVSLAGWVFLTLMSLATGNGVIGYFTHPQPPPMSPMLTGLCILAALPCLMIWMFGTTMFHLSRKRLALVQEELQRRASAQTAARVEGMPQVTFPVAPGGRAERR